MIKSLKKKLIDSYITRQEFIKVIHKKGQNLTLSSDSKTIFIAGMGGKEISEILESLISQLSENDRVVISPHRNILEVREFLSQSSLGLLDECALKEGNQFYQILCLSRDESLPKVHSYGEKIWENSEYLQHQIASFSLHQDPKSKAFVAYLNQLNS